jgi:large subunit ribosomal protein L24
MNIRKGDTVQVISGNERSQKGRGKVLGVNMQDLRIQVEGLRPVKRHLRRGRSQQTPEGGILTKAGTIALSNVMLVCPKCDKPTRVASKKTPNGFNARSCKRCGAQIDEA